MIQGKLRKRRKLLSPLIGLFLCVVMTSSLAGTFEQTTLAHLAEIRSITAEGDSSTISSNNQKMDDAWKFFQANKEVVLPVLYRELTRELEKEDPNNLILLDIGYFLRLQESKKYKEIAKNALFNLDSSSAIIRLNQKQLFQFAHSVASESDPEILHFLDRVFLEGNVTAFIPQHSLSLDETLTCVFLYGVYGPGSEEHLLSLLSNPEISNRVIEVLIWIGSPESVQEVEAAMTSKRDYDTFARATAFMMQVGGPQGRSQMLSIDIDAFDSRSTDYYAKILDDIKATSYQSLRNRFNGFPGEDVLGADELKNRLTAMYKNYGKDNETNPQAIFNSELPQKFLVKELKNIRSRMLFRLSDEALSDVSLTNAILNTLYYKP